VVEAIREAAERAQSEARAAVIYGEGDHFCAGLDLAEHKDKPLFDAIQGSRRWHAIFASFERGEIPFFSALHGAVVGGGFELAAAPQVRVADETAFFGLPEAILDDPETLACLQPRVIFRTIARSTDSRTCIAALIPPRVIPQHGGQYLLRRPNSTIADEAFVLGLLSSRLLDWWARRHVETTLTFSIYNSFPAPDVQSGHPGYEIVSRTAARLAAVDVRFSSWADDVSVECGELQSSDRFHAITLLDAAIARLMGLAAGHVRHIYETFHTGWKAEEREPYTEAVLEHLASFDWDPAPVGQE
jgi:hypothetical protein